MSEYISKPTYIKLWQLSWPLILTMFLLFTVGLADVYVAGRFSPAVQGAIGFAGQLLFFFGVFANGLGVGLVAIISRNKGSGNKIGQWHTARQGILLISLPLALLSIIGVIFPPNVTILSFLPFKVASETEPILPYYILSLWPQALLAVTGAIFRALSQMRLILLCSGSTAIFNFVGDFVLAFGYGPFPALGSSGIAIATAISSIAGALLAISLLFAQGLDSGDWWPDKTLLKNLIRISWPAGALQMGWHLGSLVLYVILGRLSSGAVAATAALTNGLRIEAILYLPVFALNMIAAVLVAEMLGSGDKLKAEETGWKISVTAAVILTIMALPVFIFSMDLAGFVSPDPLVQRMTHLYLRINMMSQPFMALGVCLAGAMEGAGDTRGVMKIVLSALWGIRIPLAAIFSLFTSLAANGVWISMVVSIILQCIFMIIRYRKGNWKNYTVT